MSFRSKSDGLRFDFSTTKLKYSSYLSWQTPLPESFEILLPDSFECLSDPQRNFGNPLAYTLFDNPLRALLLKNRYFFCFGEIFVPNTQRQRRPLGSITVPPRVLAVWAIALLGARIS